MDKVKPFLKWAGGKTQLIPEIIKRMPPKFNKYIEPFVGGGALFFFLNPPLSIIADSNPELINVYRCIRDNVEVVIMHLQGISIFLDNMTPEELFYKIRKDNFEYLDRFYACARTIYLNKTCFNGLYRLNKKGHFNSSFGKYKNPTIFDPENLRKVSEILQNNLTICGDYKEVLLENAKEGDFIFLDPPYIPISKYSDFKRYTKEQFYEEDHRKLADEVKRLQKLGCHIILTNSNHPLVYELYGDFQIDIISTKRNISSDAKTRRGEDVIVWTKGL